MLPAPAESCIFAHELSVLHAEDARHRRKRRRSASVSSPSRPRDSGSSSSSDDDAGAAGHGDYEEQDTGTPKRRSATSSKATSPAPRKQAPTGRTSESPLSRRPSEQDDSDDSADERSSAGYLSDATRGEQRATPNASKQAGGKKKRTASTRYHSNTELPSWKSDQPTGVLRAPAKPMVHVHAHRVNGCLAWKLSADGTSPEIRHGERQIAIEEKMSCDRAQDNFRRL